MHNTDKNGYEMKKKEVMSFGIIGEPDENTPQFLEELIGEPVKMRKKRDKTIFIIGRGLFKKKVVFPVERK